MRTRTVTTARAELLGGWGHGQEKTPYLLGWNQGQSSNRGVTDHMPEDPLAIALRLSRRPTPENSVTAHTKRYPN